MTIKKNTTLPVLLVAGFALSGCVDSDGPVELEKGDAVEVYHQAEDGTQTTLGFYDPLAEVFNGVSVDWDFEGYWFEANDEIYEMSGTQAPLRAEEVSLEVGASYPANLWSSESGVEDAITTGDVLVDTVPVKAGAFEAANFYCRTSVRNEWSWKRGGTCWKVTTTKCPRKAAQVKRSLTWAFKCA